MSSDERVPRFREIKPKQQRQVKDFCYTAIIDGEWALESEETFKFDEDLELAPLPKDLREYRKPCVTLGPFEAGHIEDCNHAFLIRYQDETSRDPFTNLFLRDARQRYLWAALALWIARPSLPAPPMPLNVIFERENGGWHAESAIPTPIVFLSHPSDPKPTRYPGEGLEDARRIYLHLRTSMGARAQVRVAVRTVFFALRSDDWSVRFAVLWIVMECLFGDVTKQDQTSITATVSERAGHFLQDKKNKPDQIAGRVRNSYDWRCAIVHGLHPTRMEKLKGSKAEQMAKQLEGWIRAALYKIFTVREPDLLEIFNDPKRRTKYLDSLRPPEKPKNEKAHSLRRKRASRTASSSVYRSRQV